MGKKGKKGKVKLGTPDWPYKPDGEDSSPGNAEYPEEDLINLYIPVLSAISPSDTMTALRKAMMKGFLTKSPDEIMQEIDGYIAGAGLDYSSPVAQQFMREYAKAELGKGVEPKIKLDGYYTIGESNGKPVTLASATKWYDKHVNGAETKKEKKKAEEKFFAKFGYESPSQIAVESLKQQLTKYGIEYDEDYINQLNESLKKQPGYKNNSLGRWRHIFNVYEKKVTDKRGSKWDEAQTGLILDLKTQAPPVWGETGEPEGGEWGEYPEGGIPGTGGPRPDVTDLSPTIGQTRDIYTGTQTALGSALQDLMAGEDLTQRQRERLAQREALINRQAEQETLGGLDEASATVVNDLAARGILSSSETENLTENLLADTGEQLSEAATEAAIDRANEEGRLEESNQARRERLVDLLAKTGSTQFGDVLKGVGTQYDILRGIDMDDFDKWAKARGLIFNEKTTINQLKQQKDLYLKDLALQYAQLKQDGELTLFQAVSTNNASLRKDAIHMLNTAAELGYKYWMGAAPEGGGGDMGWLSTLGSLAGTAIGAYSGMPGGAMIGNQLGGQAGELGSEIYDQAGFDESATSPNEPVFDAAGNIIKGGKGDAMSPYYNTLPDYLGEQGGAVIGNKLGSKGDLRQKLIQAQAKQLISQGINPKAISGGYTPQDFLPSKKASGGEDYTGSALPINDFEPQPVTSLPATPVPTTGTGLAPVTTPASTTSLFNDIISGKVAKQQGSAVKEATYGNTPEYNVIKAAGLDPTKYSFGGRTDYTTGVTTPTATERSTGKPLDFGSALKTAQTNVLADRANQQLAARTTANKQFLDMFKTQGTKNASGAYVIPGAYTPATTTVTTPAPKGAVGVGTVGGGVTPLPQTGITAGQIMPSQYTPATATKPLHSAGGKQQAQQAEIEKQKLRNSWNKPSGR